VLYYFVYHSAYVICLTELLQSPVGHRNPPRMRKKRIPEYAFCSSSSTRAFRVGRSLYMNSVPSASTAAWVNIPSNFECEKSCPCTWNTSWSDILCSSVVVGFCDRIPITLYSIARMSGVCQVNVEDKFSVV
jgi:hypothetical protein